jgi:DNA-binding beta-propeller fold protein YncE
MHNTQSDRPESRSTRRALRTCEFSSGSRAGVVRGFLLAVVMGLGASIGLGQPVPDTILLPDSLGPLRLGSHLAFGSSTSNIYVASESSDILVVDGETFQRIDRINTGPVGGVVLVGQTNRLYCSFPQQGRVGVIDCASNSITRTIDVGTRPTLLCYNSDSNKLYCGDTIDHTVTAIDCAADTVCKVIPVGRNLSAMVYDPTSNKVYAATRDGVCAISCVSDSIVANIDAVKSSRALCVNKRRQKLYAVGPVLPGPDPETLYVISTGIDSVVAKMYPYRYVDPLRLVCNEVTDRLYSMDYYGDFLEYDCDGDTSLRFRALGGRPQFGVPCDTVRNRLYYLVCIAMDGYIRTLDCATLEVISTTRVGDSPAALEQDLDRRRVILSESGTQAADAVLTVFDCKLDSLFTRGYAPLCGNLDGAVHNPVDRKLYYRWGMVPGALGVIDERTNRVVRHMFPPEEPFVGELEYCRTGSKLYCGATPGLAVLDGESDSVLKLVNLAGGRAANLCWVADYNKLYCNYTDLGGTRYYMAVLDCYTDSVIKTMEFYDWTGSSIYVGNGRLFFLYGARMALIDCRNDSVLVDTTYTGSIDALAHTAVGEKIYLVRGSSKLEVLSSRTLALLATVEWGYFGWPPRLECSDTTRKLYWFKVDNSLRQPDSVLVMDTRGDTVVARLAAGFWQRKGCWDHSGRYLFCPDDSCSITIYDTQTDSVAGVYENLPTCASVIANPEQHGIYANCGDVILAYPDAPPAVEEMPNAGVRVMKMGPTVVRGVLFLSLDRRPGTGDRSVLMDVSGRKLMDLRAGANDVSALAPGVYYLRGQGSRGPGSQTTLRKILIAK